MPKKMWMFPGEVIPKQKAFPGDCDDIRRKISSFLATNTMTKAEFLRQCGAAIGKETVNSGSYASFMSRKGPCEGEDMGLYQAATAFFAAHPTDTGSTPASRKANKADAAASFAALCSELDEIEIPGEDVDEGCYDSMTCTVVRRRLNEFIGAEGITQSALIAYLGVNSNSWGECRICTAHVLPCSWALLAASTV
jgi:hypothetical protein